MTPLPKITNPYNRSAEEVLQELQTANQGLSQPEAQERLKILGANRLEEKGKL